MGYGCWDNSTNDMPPSLKIKEILCILYSGLLFLTGALLIGCSVVLAYKLFYHFKFAPTSSIAPLITIFLLGFLHLFLTWLGIRGPSKEHDFHIIVFIILTGTLLLTHFGVAIWSLLIRREVDYESVNLMNESFEGLLASDYDKKEWVRLQMKLKCCAIHGPADYAKKASIPLACCNHEKAANSTCPEVYDVGCREPLIGYLKRIFAEAAILCFTSGAVQVLGIVAFYFFLKELKKVRADRHAQLAAIRNSTANGSGSAANAQTLRAGTLPPVAGAPRVD